ncbi:hypothetical protein T02_9891 [Trichinella nativa]|uniref:Uncharacterized protein n=1 Tax=Trichinella nativa TaxID=6335 RepID=A0A0V1LC90_9BILA|nr:hypothetical protein T02_9891 [Trichinella nativa]
MSFSEANFICHYLQIILYSFPIGVPYLACQCGYVLEKVLITPCDGYKCKEFVQQCGQSLKPPLGKVLVFLTLLNILMVIMVTGSRSSCSFVGIEEIYLVDFFNAKNFLIHTIERSRRMLNNCSNAKFTCLFIQNYSNKIGNAEDARSPLDVLNDS